MVLSSLLFSSGRFSPSRFSLPSLSQPNANDSSSNRKLSGGAATSDATIGATAAATLDAARLSLLLPVTFGERNEAFALPPVASCGP